jgi:hypothetical protein
VREAGFGFVKHQFGYSLSLFRFRCGFFMPRPEQNPCKSRSYSGFSACKTGQKDSESRGACPDLSKTHANHGLTLVFRLANLVKKIVNRGGACPDLSKAHANHGLTLNTSLPIHGLVRENEFTEKMEGGRLELIRF